MRKSKIKINKKIIVLVIVLIAIVTLSIIFLPKIVSSLPAKLTATISDMLEDKKEKYPQKYSDLVSKYAAKYNLPEYIVYGIIKTESSFIPDAESYAGAKGLMQIMPTTLYWINAKNGTDYLVEDLFDPECNINCGCFFISYLYYEDFNNWDCAIAAYNAGRTRVYNWLEDPEISPNGVLTNIPIEETANYLVKVKNNSQQYLELYYSEQTEEK